MRIIINVDDGRDDVIEFSSWAVGRRGYTDHDVIEALRQAREQLAADLVENAPEAAKAITELLDARREDESRRVKEREALAAEVAAVAVETER